MACFIFEGDIDISICGENAESFLITDGANITGIEGICTNALSVSGSTITGPISNSRLGAASFSRSKFTDASYSENEGITSLEFCTTTRTRFADCTMHDVDITECIDTTFERVAFQGGMVFISRGKNVTFKSCLFSDVCLAAGTIHGCSFVECTIGPGEIDRAMWRDAEVENCKFIRKIQTKIIRYKEF